ncbi:alpha-rhamnosidase [Clostridia bacterium]|nr:alpha-rhamnosidase [Clostridia bacterium]
MSLGAAPFIKPDAPFVWDYKDENLAPMFRRVFTADAFHTAEVTLCALGLGVFTLNGQPITDDLFISPNSDYNKTLWFVRYDITHMLHEGENVLCCILGNGWYNETLKTPWEFREASWRDNPKFSLALRCDGKTILVSDNVWRCKPCSHIVFNQLRSGERFDARLFDPQWTALGFDDSSWATAIVDQNPPCGIPRLNDGPPVRACAEFPAINAVQTGEKRYVFDIGQNISGYVRLRGCQKSGDILTIRYSEQLNSNGSLNLNGMGGFYPLSPFQRDVYICGDGTFDYSPSFVYHGFRYVEIVGLNHSEPAMVSGIYAHADVKQIGWFECSNQNINRLFDIGVNAVYSNMQYMLTDCPTREKFGWLNDAKASAEQIFLHFDAAGFFKKWYRDILDSVREDGAIPGIAPTSGCLYDDWTGPICSGALFEIPYKLYLYTGDDSLLREGFDAFLLHLKYIRSKADADGLIGFGLPDWAGPFEDLKIPPTPVRLTDSALYIEFLQRTLFTANHLCRVDDAREVEAELTRMTAVFKEAYLNADGSCVCDEQTAVSMILVLGLFDALEPLKAQLKAAVEKYDCHIHCGMLGIRYLYDALHMCGLDEYALRVITAVGFPSYMEWLRGGATTLWETFYLGHSKNHHMYSCFMQYLTDTLAGLRPDTNVPGMRRVVINPVYVTDLEWVTCRREMGEGQLTVSWRRENGLITLTLHVPDGVEAEHAGEVLSCGEWSFQY